MNTSACTMAINIDDNPVNMIIDSSCNIIPEATFRKMPGLTLKCSSSSSSSDTSAGQRFPPHNRTLGVREF